jgi:hypothetical protein
VRQGRPTQGEMGWKGIRDCVIRRQGRSFVQVSFTPACASGGKPALPVHLHAPVEDEPSGWTGCLDRSPCGKGTCARMAAISAKGELPLSRDFRHEGILGTVFTGRLLRETRVGDYPAVVPILTGTAWITGFASYLLDPEDPFLTGFTVGDIWGVQEGSG